MTRSQAAWKFSLVAILLILLSFAIYFNDAEKFEASYQENADGSLTLHFQNGLARTFVNNIGSNVGQNVSYKMIHYFADEGFFAIRETYHEGGSGLVVSAKDGSAYQTFCETPAFSNNGQWMVSYCLDIAAGFSRNGLDVWKVKDGSLEKVFSVKTEEWGPTDVVWTDDKTISFQRKIWKGNELVNGDPGRLYLKDDSWQMN